MIEKTKIPLDIFGKSVIISHVPDAGVAHPVERHLAKVEVASSSLVTRSIKIKAVLFGRPLFLWNRGDEDSKI